MKKMQMILLIIFMPITLCSCGNSGVSKEEYDKVVTERDSYKAQIEESNAVESSTAEIEYIDGFEKADFNKFNAYASENKLDGTPIYIDGEVTEKISLSDGTIGFVLQQNDGNKWCVVVGMKPIFSENNIDVLVEKKVRVFGVYIGFSDLYEMPGIYFANEQCYIVEIDSQGIELRYDDFLASEISKEEKSGTDESAEQQRKSAEEQSHNLQEEKNENPLNASSPTIGQKNALNKAKEYLEIMPFSYSGLIEQLEFEKFTNADAVYAADNCGADWSAQATKKAKSYLEIMSFSKEGLIDQLKFDGFTTEQATYGVEQNGY